MSELVAGAYGVAIDVETGRDLSGATAAAIHVETDLGAARAFPAEIADAAAGRLRYVTLAGDFPPDAVTRVAQVQAVVDFGPGVRLRSQTVRLTLLRSVDPAADPAA